MRKTIAEILAAYDDPNAVNDLIVLSAIYELEVLRAQLCRNNPPLYPVEVRNLAACAHSALVWYGVPERRDRFLRKMEGLREAIALAEPVFNANRAAYDNQQAVETNKVKP